MSFVGRLDDTFVFTRNNDVITFSRADGIQKTETNLDHLDVATIWNDAIIVAGDADEFTVMDTDGETILSSNGPLSGDNIHITLIGEMEYGDPNFPTETVLLFDNGLYGTFISEGWGMGEGV